jgi:ubiquinone/menaquinone biosynthesis C-methylase UbiE
MEVGSGPGYFSAEIARVIPDGKLILTDIQEEMLELARKRLSRKRITNIEYHLCNGIDIPFEDNKFDLIYMVTVLGEVENKEQYIREIFRILKPGGVLSISEQAGGPDKISIEEIKKLVYGFEFKFDKLYGTKNNFTINFRK